MEFANECIQNIDHRAVFVLNILTGAGIGKTHVCKRTGGKFTCGTKRQ